MSCSKPRQAYFANRQPFEQSVIWRYTKFKKIDFLPQKFLMTLVSPIFAVSVHFPPISGKLLFPHYFAKFLSDFVKFTCFTCLMSFSFPPSLTMMHLCIAQCTYWTPLPLIVVHFERRHINAQILYSIYLAVIYLAAIQSSVTRDYNKKSLKPLSQAFCLFPQHDSIWPIILSLSSI